MIKKIAMLFGLSEQGSKNFLIAAMMELVNNIVSMLPMAFFIFFLFDLSQKMTNDDYLMSGYLYLGIGACIVLLLYLSNYFSYTNLYVSTYRESAATRLRLAEKMRELPMSYYSRKNASELSNILMNDVADLERFFSHALPKITALVPFLILIAVGLAFMDWQLTLVGFSVIPISIVIWQCVRVYEEKAHNLYFAHLTRQSESFQELIERIKEIRLLNRRKQVRTEIAHLLDEQERVHRKTELPTALSQGMISAVLQSGIGLVIIFGSYQYAYGALNLIELMIFLLAFNRVYNMVIGIYENLAMFRYTKVRIKRLKSLYQEKPQQGLRKPSFSNYRFVINHLTFGYKESDTIIQDISFAAEEGKITALVGPSGSGKTTIIRLLSRLYDYTTGSVSLGGEELKTIDTEYLFQHISVVFQDVILFNTSILENIRIGKKDATEEEVLLAARQARCDEFALDLPDGYDTVIGENGGLLSGGERQRISIARAFLKNAPILFLDETSSALDSENEFAVQQALSGLVKGKTVVVIAHRLKTIENADRIIVLDQGSIVEQGTKDSLLAHDGMFKKQYLYEQ